LSQDPWVDGRLDDEGPGPGERRAAILIAVLVIGSIVLRGASGRARIQIARSTCSR
jgi:hypothetical protein